MKDHHPILKSQIREHIGTTASSVESLRPFLSSINDIYWRLHPHLSHPHPPISEQFLSHVQYQNIFESSSTALTILSDDAVILLANREFEEMSGYKKADLEGKKALPSFFRPVISSIFSDFPKIGNPHARSLRIGRRQNSPTETAAFIMSCSRFPQFRERISILHRSSTFRSASRRKRRS